MRQGRSAAAVLVMALLASVLAVLPGTAAPAAAASRATTQACPAGDVPAAGLGDVEAGSTHAGAVDCLLWWAVTQGRSPGAYDPGSGVTRGQMASFLVRLLQRTGAQVPDSPADRFPDDAGSTHEANINRLAALGITGGYSDGTYRPDQQVPRDQMASFLVRVAEKQLDAALPAGADAFGDDSTSTHQPNINKAAEAGLTGGTAGGGYDPAGTVRRDQMASFLTRLLDLVVADRLALARVVVAGLPDGTVAPTVTLTSAAEPRPRLAAGTGVVALPAGEWALTGPDVGVAGQTWTPVAVPAQPLVAGVTRLPLTYTNQPLDEGDLAADVVPLPDGTPVAYEPQAGTVTLPPGAAPGDLDAGDVLIARPSDSAPDGVLARVLARSEQDGQVVLATEPATLMDAYPAGTGELDLQVQDITFDPAEGVTVDAPTATAKSPLTRAAELNVRGPTLPLRVDVKAGVDGGFGREGRAWDPNLGVFVHLRGPVQITPTMRLEAGWTSASARLGLETRTDLDVSLGASAATAGTLNKVFERKLGKAKAYGCASVVCATLTGEVFLTVSATGELRWDFHVATRSTASVGLVTDRRGTRPTFDADISIDTLEHQRFTAQGTVEAFAGGDLALKLYAAAGPYVKVGPYAQLKLAGRTDQTPICNADGGIRGAVGLRAGFKLLGAGLEASAESSHDFPLSTSTCTTPPTSPSGSNPPTSDGGDGGGSAATASVCSADTTDGSRCAGNVALSTDGRWLYWSSTVDPRTQAHIPTSVFLTDTRTSFTTLAVDGHLGRIYDFKVSDDGNVLLVDGLTDDPADPDDDYDYGRHSSRKQVYVWTRTTGILRKLTQPRAYSDEEESFGRDVARDPNGPSELLALSGDGLSALVSSSASDLPVYNDKNGIYHYDLATGQARVAGSALPGDVDNYYSSDVALTHSGGTGVFFTRDDVGRSFLYYLDVKTGSIQAAPLAAATVADFATFRSLQMSEDGRLVLLACYADLGRGSQEQTVCLHDRAAGTTKSLGRQTAVGEVDVAALSRDGARLVLGRSSREEGLPTDWHDDDAYYPVRINVVDTSGSELARVDLGNLAREYYASAENVAIAPQGPIAVSLNSNSENRPHRHLSYVLVAK